MVVLVADDEDLVRSVVVRLLECLGHDVVPVKSGFAAISTLEERSDIGLAILDERMPELRGSEVLAKLRALHPTMPALLSTGDIGLKNDDPRVMVLSKPYGLKKLEAAIAKVCS